MESHPKAQGPARHTDNGCVRRRQSRLKNMFCTIILLQLRVEKNLGYLYHTDEDWMNFWPNHSTKLQGFELDIESCSNVLSSIWIFKCLGFFLCPLNQGLLHQVFATEWSARKQQMSQQLKRQWCQCWYCSKKFGESQLFVTSQVPEWQTLGM